jgi:hypothetical protein
MLSFNEAGPNGEAMATMNKNLSSMRDSYLRDGFVLGDNCLKHSTISALRSVCDVRIANPSKYFQNLTGRSRGLYAADRGIWQSAPEILELLNEGGIGAMACALMGAQWCRIYYDQISVKAASTPVKTPWHQDIPYLPLKGLQFITIWIALDDCSSDNGALEYVPGSHLWPAASHRSSGYELNLRQSKTLPKLPDIDLNRSSLDVVSFSLRAGQYVFHHGLTAHGAKGNASDRSNRRAYIIRLYGEDLVYAPHGDAQPLPFPTDVNPGAKIVGQNYPIFWKTTS